MWGGGIAWALLLFKWVLSEHHHECYLNPSGGCYDFDTRKLVSNLHKHLTPKKGVNMTPYFLQCNYWTSHLHDITCDIADCLVIWQQWLITWSPYPEICTMHMSRSPMHTFLLQINKTSCINFTSSAFCYLWLDLRKGGTSRISWIFVLKRLYGQKRALCPHISGHDLTLPRSIYFSLHFILWIKLYVCRERPGPHYNNIPTKNDGIPKGATK